MHTRITNKTTKTFTVVVWDWNNNECFRSEFVDLHEADLAAAREERAMTLRMQMPSIDLGDINDMSDDELLLALSA